MKNILLLLALTIIATSCSSDDGECGCKTAQFVNIETMEYKNAKTDCNKTPPDSTYIFVKCVSDEPSY